MIMMILITTVHVTISYGMVDIKTSKCHMRSHDIKVLRGYCFVGEKVRYFGYFGEESIVDGRRYHRV